MNNDQQTEPYAWRNKPTAYIISPTIRKARLVRHIGIRNFETDEREPVCCAMHKYPMVETNDKDIPLCERCQEVETWSKEKRLARVWKVRFD